MNEKLLQGTIFFHIYVFFLIKQNFTNFIALFFGIGFVNTLL